MSLHQTATPTLPSHSTPFVGRERELRELSDMLTDPVCRLLTIFGPGGIGKTRLTIETAAQNQPLFPDGVVFVPLQPLLAADEIPSAIAAVLALQLMGRDNPLAQMLNYLRDKHMLLVLDNMEHLLDGSDLLSTMLAAAPGLKLLVTSRELLNLQEEWLYPLDGLDIPADHTAADLSRNSAVQLFVERARRVRRDFALAAERDSVVRICQLVEGLPLAIELAAVWTKTLPCAVIAAEIGRNLAFLATSLRNVPERHRSMRATFDQSWGLLTEEQRQVFQRLAVFRGGLAHDAAEQVAGASLPILATLVEKSLVRHEPGGRYHLHELLRQYAEEHLRALPEMAHQTQQAHSSYYMALLAEQRVPITGGDQLAALAHIGCEFENMRVAWRWAVDHADMAAIGQAAHTLSLYYRIQGSYQEGIAALE